MLDAWCQVYATGDSTNEWGGIRPGLVSVGSILVLAIILEVELVLGLCCRALASRREPGLGVPTLWVGATRAVQQDLLARGADLTLCVFSQVGGDKVGDGADEDGRVVEALRASQVDAELERVSGRPEPRVNQERTTTSRSGGRREGMPHLFRLLLHLNVQLVKRLDVVRGESDGHETDILLALLGETDDRIRRLGTLPCARTDLGLPRQAPAEVGERDTSPAV